VASRTPFRRAQAPDLLADGFNEFVFIGEFERDIHCWYNQAVS
jgi:hypothetical protein